MFKHKLFSLSWISCLLIANLATAQPTTIDSLSQVLESTQEDSARIILLEQLAQKLIYKAPTEAIQYADQILTITDSQDKKWYREKKRFAYSLKGHVYRIERKFDQSKSTFGSLLDWATANKDTSMISKAYGDLAYVYADEEKYDSATIYDLEALVLNQQINSPNLGKSYNNLGYDYKMQRDYQKALDYYQKALYYKQQNEQISSIGNTYMNIANTFLKLEVIDSAFYYANEALKAAQIQKDSLFVGQIAHNIGEIYLTTKEYQEAEQYFKQALKIFEQIQVPNKATILTTYQELGRVYIESNQLNEAEKVLLQAEQLLLKNEMNISDGMEANLELLEQLYWDKMDYQKARAYSKQLIEVIDTLHRRAMSQEVYQLLTKYEDELKEKKIETLEQQQKIVTLENERVNRQKSLLIGLAIVLLLLLVVVFSLNRWRSRVNQELQTLNNTKDKLFSIIAHDLKNPLSAFRSITQTLSENILEIEKQDLEYFIEQLNHSAHSLFDLLQNLLYWSISQSGKLEFTPQAILLNTAVERMVLLLSPNASQKNIAVHNNIPPKQQVYADIKMLETILRNLIANAIKFTEKGGQITIESKLLMNENNIAISIIDTGIGIDAQRLSTIFEIGSHQQNTKVVNAGTGLGLILCKELVEKQHGNIKVTSALGKGSTFTFTLPLSDK